MRKFVKCLLGILIVFTLLLAGCGDDDDGTQIFQLNDCRLDDASCRLQ